MYTLIENGGYIKIKVVTWIKYPKKPHSHAVFDVTTTDFKKW